jgi:hypothetical protein
MGPEAGKLLKSGSAVNNRNYDDDNTGRLI